MLAALVALSAAVPAHAQETAAPAPDGTPFHFIGMVYLAGRIEFRDPTGEKWPNYFYEGKFGDVRGKLLFDAKQPRLNAALNCTRLCQPNDGMELKILGEVMKPEGAPPVRFTIASMGAWLPPAAPDKPGAKAAGPYDAAPIAGELDVDGRKVPVKCTAHFRWVSPKKGDLKGLAANSLLGTSVHLTAQFTIKGRDLGLKAAAEKEIAVTVHTRAYTEATILEGTKKKSLAEAGVKE
jgi:hypothetical protein